MFWDLFSLRVGPRKRNWGFIGQLWWKERISKSGRNWRACQRQAEWGRGFLNFKAGIKRRKEGRSLWFNLFDTNVIWRLLFSLVYNWDVATLSRSIFKTWVNFKYMHQQFLSKDLQGSRIIFLSRLWVKWIVEGNVLRLSFSSCSFRPTTETTDSSPSPSPQPLVKVPLVREAS